MARFLSHIVTDARGSVAGTTFSKNKTGLYMRSKVKGGNPSTAAQSVARGKFGAISQQWRGLLPEERNAWDEAAQFVSWQDSLGQSFTPSGFQLFMQRNNNLQAIDEDVITQPVVAPSAPVVAIDDLIATHEELAPDTLDYFIGVSGDATGWVAEIQASAPIGAGIASIPAGRYRTIATRTDPTDAEQAEISNDWRDIYRPGSGDDMFANDVGQKIFVRMRVVHVASGVATPWTSASEVISEV